MNRQALDDLKQQIPLMGYLQAHDWTPARPLSRGRWMGLCPLHADHQPSFLVDANKDLFYCYGCGRGGDVIRFAELYHQVKFPQALALLQQWRGLAPLLHEAASFYRMQLHRHGEVVAYLHQRGVRSPELVEHMRIGYAPGGCLRGWLTQLGYPRRRRVGTSVCRRTPVAQVNRSTARVGQVGSFRESCTVTARRQFFQYSCARTPQETDSFRSAAARCS